MKKKITYVSNSLIPSLQANSVHVINMASSLAKFGALDDFFAYKGFVKKNISSLYGLKKNLKIKFYFLSQAPFFNFLEIFFMYFRTNKNSIIFGRNIKICIFFSFLGSKVIFETHQPISSYTYFERKLFYIFRTRISRIVCITHALKKILLKELEIDEKKIHVLPDAANKKKVIKKNKPQKLKKIGYFGSLIKGRGIDIIILLAKELKEYEFHIAGGNEYLIRKLSNKKLKNIIFHGYLDEDKVVLLRNKMDVLLAPYQINTNVQGGKVTSQWMSPLKIFEYMASKKPFIASDIEVLKEVLTDNNNCLLVKPNSISEWINAIKKILNDEKMSKKLIENAYKIFEKKYTWDIRAKKIIDICEEID